MLPNPFNRLDFRGKKSIFIVDTLMKTRIQKWGNSLALRIPRAFAEESKVTQGSAVDLSIENGRLIITPVQKNPYTLKELLAGVSKKNLHGEIDMGPPIGKEVW